MFVVLLNGRKIDQDVCEVNVEEEYATMFSIIQVTNLLGCPTPKDLLRTKPSSRKESARDPPGFLITFGKRGRKR